MPTNPQPETLLAHLMQIKDPRIDLTKQHLLIDISVAERVITPAS